MGFEWKEGNAGLNAAAVESSSREGIAVRRGEDLGELPAYTLWRGLREYPQAWGPLLEARQASWPSQPRFHLVILSPDGDEARLAATIRSLTGQWYTNIHLSVIFSREMPEGLVASGTLDWHERKENLLESANQLLLEGDGDWVGLVSAGDEVASHALFYWAEAAFSHPGWKIIYSDEDRLGASGPELPHFKPDFNLDLLRSHGYIGGLLLTRRDFFAGLGGFNPQLSGVEEHDLVLRAYEADGGRVIGHIPDVLYHRLNEGGYCKRSVNELVMLGNAVVQSHLERLGVDARVEEGYFQTSWRVTYRYPDIKKVSVLVSGSGDLAQLQRCLESILERTDYPDYEVLVADTHANGEVDAWLAQLDLLGEPRLRVHFVAQGLVRSALFNALAAEAQGDFLVFLHGDCAVMQESWLADMISHARRPEVGVVSPRLATAKGRLLGGGGVLGMKGAAASPFSGTPLDAPGYWGRAHLEQDFNVLHGGCLMMEKALLLKMGGFDHHFEDDAQNICDLSLRVTQEGYLAVWTPFITLLCEDEGQGSPGSWQEFLYKWRAGLPDDPAYNRNLDLGNAGFYLDPRPETGVDPLPWRPIPKIMAHQADIFGCGEYRIIAPARALQHAGRAQTWTNFSPLNEAQLTRLRPDVAVMQRPNLGMIPFIESYRKFGDTFTVYEIDDLLSHITLRSPARESITGDMMAGVVKTIALCDRFVVSTPVLADLYRTLHADIRVVPNYLERARWGGFTPVRRLSSRPRVGWAGGASHVGDLEMMVDVVRELADEVDWVFFGLCPDSLRPFVREVHEGVPLPRYQDKLAALNLDLAIAPLEIHLFNEAKSNLRILEYGIMGYPVICTDITPYRGDHPVTRVPNKHGAWIAAIREKLSDWDALAAEGDNLRRHVEQHWMLEDHLDEWLAAWLPG
jgi:GT2 family glycosyltransferase/glycosyltransferase involved in cell wall biosynthesis